MITGASSGIGAHFSQLTAGRGANVLIGARRIDRLKQLAKEIEGVGGKTLAVELDVSDEASVIAAFDAAEARFGSVDCVVANAGGTAQSRAISAITRA